MTRAVLLVALTTAIASTGSAARASQPYELPNVMIVAKSSNRNEVHYAAYVDATCAPVTKTPMHPYWLMLERGPGITEPLSPRELGILGVASQEVSADAVRFVVNGLPSRAFVAHTGHAPDGTCTSWVDTTIAGAQAQLLGIYVKEKLFGVDYVLLTGRTLEGKAVQERVSR